jgi:hypothetical protein
MPREVILDQVNDAHSSKLWNWIVSEYHYLGLTTPVGRALRYVVLGDGKLIGAISFSECAWNVASRNAAMKAIGLDVAGSRDFIIANNRFVVLPTARVPNLASRVLSLSVEAAARDWLVRFGQQPLIAETFIDPLLFRGTCYYASNWLFIGNTKGYAKAGSHHRNERRPKLLLLRGLNPLIHRKLELAYPPGDRARWTEAA